MEARAYLRNVRMSPRKIQIILNLIRNKSVEEATAILKYTPRIACEPLLKLLNSAVANGVNDPAKNMDRKNMYVAECFVTQGPTLKRIRPRAQGRAFSILKRSSHVTLVVRERE